jgi:hypothetical protein
MDIQNYEDNYLIYEDGRVQNKKTGRFLKASINKGYYVVCLCKNGVQKIAKIHRLVAIHYIPNTNPNFKIINHINCDRADNRIENLEWCDMLYNTQSKNTTSNVGCVCLKTDKKRTKPYEAKITINRVLHSKCFKTEQEGRDFILNLSLQS